MQTRHVFPGLDVLDRSFCKILLICRRSNKQVELPWSKSTEIKWLLFALFSLPAVSVKKMIWSVFR